MNPLRPFRTAQLREHRRHHPDHGHGGERNNAKEEAAPRSCQYRISKRRRYADDNDGANTSETRQGTIQYSSNEFVEKWLEQMDRSNAEPWRESDVLEETQNTSRYRLNSSHDNHRHLIPHKRKRHDRNALYPPGLAFEKNGNLPLVFPACDEYKVYSETGQSLHEASSTDNAWNRKAISKRPSKLVLPGELHETGYPTHQQRDRTSNSERSLPKSSSSVSRCFGRRPRRKTREDKYDRKRLCEHDTAGSKKHHRSSKSKKRVKRKTGLTSKNVMTQFDSTAVLNDHITVPPSLKPGIFKNRREATSRPVPDLAFSEMQFLQDRKRDPNSKTLSKSRLRELEKQRELEQVSSYFLPPTGDRDDKDGKISQHGSQENRRGDEIRQIPEPSCYRQHIFSEHSSVGQEDAIEANPPQHECASLKQASDARVYAAANDAQHSGRTSKATTYISWSSSQPRSPSQNTAVVSNPSKHRSHWSSTPGSIRQALINTGVYCGTGLLRYDDKAREPAGSGIDHTASVISVETSQSREDAKSREPTSKSIAQTEANDIAQYMLNRWQDIKASHLHPGQAVPLPKSTGQTQSQVGTRKVAGNSQQTDHIESDHIQGAKKVNGMSERERRAKEARIGRSRTKQLSPSRSRYLPNADLEALSRGYEQGHIQALESQLPSASERASVASRDAMPPPPLPMENVKPRDQPPSQISEDLRRHRHLPSLFEISVAQEMHNQPTAENVEAAQEDTTTQDIPESAQNIFTRSNSAISSIQSFSWIGQTPPPPTLLSSRGTLTARTGKKGSVYLHQAMEWPPAGGPGATLSVAHEKKGESISDFIARIESEAERALSEPPGAAPVTGDKLNKDGVTGLEQPYDEIGASEMPAAISSDLLSPDVKGWLYEPSDKLAAVPARGDRWAETFLPEDIYAEIDDDGKFDEERYEMSTFWRPNQFSQI